VAKKKKRAKSKKKSKNSWTPAQLKSYKAKKRALINSI
jgi:hypothetical protein